MKVAIVNDLATAREALRRAIASAPGHEVAWLAADGAEAVEHARRQRPDLILMDLVMPGVDGAEATRRIMAECPCPIVVVTASVSGNLRRVYEAMGHGALDAVETPRLGPTGCLDGCEALMEKVAMVAKLHGPAPTATPATTATATKAPGPRRDATQGAGAGPLVLLGCSTGGPNALEVILRGLPPAWDTPVVIIQHVDAAFAGGLAAWLSERSGRAVAAAREGQAPGPGDVLLAASNDHLVLDADRRLRYTAEPRDSCYRPSVDVFFESAARHWPGKGAAALLTGMGRDGAAGLARLRAAGWLTIAQDRPSSVIWGMPRAAVEIGAAARILPLSQISDALAAAPARPQAAEKVTP